MSWLTPLTRREITLLLFALTVYILFYNVDSSLQTLGLSAAELQQNWLSKVGLQTLESSIPGPDGRKSKPWRDRLELEIFGDWEWEEGKVAGDSHHMSQGKGVGKYGAMWQDHRKLEPISSNSPGAPTVDAAIQSWTSIPTTEIVHHVKGYTVLHNLIVYNGVVYIVADDPSAVPLAESISLSKTTSGGNSFQVVSTSTAAAIIPAYGARIHGTTLLSMSSIPETTTLLSAWRVYSSLDTDIDASGRTILPPPRRLVFPNIKEYSDPRPDDILDLRARTPSNIGFQPLFAQAIFPSIGIEYSEDWNDYHSSEAPFLVETAVIVDREANPQQSLSELSSFPSSEFWLEPVREALSATLDTYQERGHQSKQSVVTYIHNQDAATGLRLKDSDHKQLVSALHKLGRNTEVHVVSSQDDWRPKLKAVTQSTIVLGTHGDHLLDSIYLRPSQHSTVMEFFPPQGFSSKVQEFIKEAGYRYIAWQNDLQFDSELPQGEAKLELQEVPIDVQAIITSIRSALKR
jgi:hypothetical protein